MKQVEIDRLLQWTFRDQLSKRQGLSTPNVWSIYERHMRLGVSVSTGRNQSDFGDLRSFPEADALIVASEVQRLNPCTCIAWPESKVALLGEYGAIAPRDVLLVFNEADLVIEYAQLGIHPMWNVGCPTPKPIILANGKPEVSGKRYGKDRYSEGSCCPLQWGSPTIEGFILARARYAVWHSALTRLVEALRGKLKSIAVVESSSPAAPWL